MRQPLQISILICLVLAFSSCTERIDVQVDSSFTRLVVEGAVTTDTMPHVIRLSTTSDYFHNQIAPSVSGAVIEVSDGEELFLFTESETRPGYYYSDSDFHGVPGKTYILEIREVDIDSDGIKEIYTASSRLNPANPVDSVKLEYFDSFFSGYEVNIYAWDSPKVDFYAFKVLKNKKLLTDTLSELLVQNDEFFNGNYTNGITSQFLNDDKPDEKVFVGDTITFELNGITEEYYHYVIEAQSQIYPQTPLFSGPPANISSNISGEAIGFFTAYSVQRCSTIATEDVVGGGSR